MSRFFRRPFPLIALALGLLQGLQGCSRDLNRSDLSGQIPIVRIRLVQGVDQIVVAASQPPFVRAASDSSQQSVPLASSTPVAMSGENWRFGSVMFGRGELLIMPAVEGSVSINGQAYRGRYRLVPTGGGHFDVINDVDIDGYLKGVVSKELLWNWEAEAYKAQAIVARTYALYESKTAPANRSWDLYPDQRSQVYGGLGAETSKSRDSVDATAGVVVAYGPPGQEKIFKAYFSSCCGGVTQSAADAFGDPYIEALGEVNNGTTCSVSPRFNWGPIAVSKPELTRRFRAWGAKKGRPEKDIAPVMRIDVQAVNHLGRPVRFMVSDSRGNRYSLSGEELRWAVNTEAQDGTTLNSSFVKVVNDTDINGTIRFIDGHGWGHGVGMCQWCAEKRAEAGYNHSDIILMAYPHSTLVRAY